VVERTPVRLEGVVLAASLASDGIRSVEDAPNLHAVFSSVLSGALRISAGGVYGRK
jgi:hypothetical protein